MDNNTVYYVVKVNGMEVTPKWPDRMMAENSLLSLPDDQRLLAEVVTVTADGKQMLLG